jgi:hypothetical protein
MHVHGGMILTLAILLSLSGAAGFAVPPCPARFGATSAASRWTLPPSSRKWAKSGAPGRVKMEMLTSKGRALSDAPAKMTPEQQAETQASIAEKLRVLDRNKQTWAETSPQVRGICVRCRA